MTKLITFHSYRGGTGTTTITANVAACVARYGYRVGLLDLNWAAPGLPVLFGFGEEGVDRSLQDALQNRKTLEETAYDVTFCLGSGSKSASKLYLIPGAPLPHWSLATTETEPASDGDADPSSLVPVVGSAPGAGASQGSETEPDDRRASSEGATIAAIPDEQANPEGAAIGLTSDSGTAAETAPGVLKAFPTAAPAPTALTEPLAGPTPIDRLAPAFPAEPPPAPSAPALTEPPADPVAHLAQPLTLDPQVLGQLQTAITALGQALKLDYLFVDTPSGFGGNIWQAIAPSQVLLLILRPDQQDYPGTALSIQIAQQIQIPRCLLVVNPAPKTLDSDKLKAKLEEAYGLTVASVLPHSTRMMSLASADLFVTRHTDHPLTQGLETMARLVML